MRVLPALVLLGVVSYASTFLVRDVYIKWAWKRNVKDLITTTADPISQESAIRPFMSQFHRVADRKVWPSSKYMGMDMDQCRKQCFSVKCNAFSYSYRRRGICRLHLPHTIMVLHAPSSYHTYINQGKPIRGSGV